MSREHGSRSARRSGPKARAWWAVGAVVLGGAGAAVGVMTSSSSGQGPANGPIKTSVNSLDLAGSSATVRELPARSTEPFSMVGLTWSSAGTALRGKVQIRTRSAATGKWTGWLTMAQADSIPDRAELNRPGVRGGMSPLWAGPSNGVQVRAVASQGVAALPQGLTVDLIDPGSVRSRGGTSAPAMAPAGYVMAATDSPTPTDTTSTTGTTTGTTTATPTDTATATAAPSPTDTASPTATTSATATSTAPAASTSATDSSSPSASSSASASASATPWPSQVPTLDEAYPSCPSSSTSAPASASASASAPPAPDPMPSAPASPIAPPTVTTRAGWGADECARESGYPSYGSTVKVMFVHHTDTTNDYTCDQSPAIIRGLYAAHLRQGWRDIGYNFLVDKCGTIYEGRFGGMELPVVGAQTYGFNTNSMGVAALGTYTDLSGGDSTASTYPGAAPSDAMKGAIARLAAWKLGMYGIDPGTGTGTLTEGASNSSGFTYGQSYTFNAISGHRNGFATDCPGNQLYNALPAIRSYASGPVSGLAVSSISGRYTTYKSGSSYVTGTSATVHWTTTTPTAVISGFDVLVDGTAVAHTSSGASSATVTLSGGTHNVQVRATHISGKTSVSANASVIADTVAPTFPTQPWVYLRPGTVNTGAVPVTVAWGSADDIHVYAQAGIYPSYKGLGAAATRWYTTAKSGTSDLFRIRATDLGGNVTYASAYRTPSIIQESSASRYGSWSTRSSSNYLGGYSLSSGTKGASLTWTFTGRSVAWIVSRATASGQAYIYIDGSYVKTVDLYSGTTLYRNAVWTRTWSSSGKHTLKIVVVGTSGRPTVTTDGIAVVN